MRKIEKLIGNLLSQRQVVRVFEEPTCSFCSDLESERDGGDIAVQREFAQRSRRPSPMANARPQDFS